MNCPIHSMHVPSSYQVILAVLWMLQHYVISCSLYHCFITARLQHSQHTACLPQNHQGLIWHLNRTPRLCQCWPILSRISSIKGSNSTREIHPGHACLSCTINIFKILRDFLWPLFTLAFYGILRVSEFTPWFDIWLENNIITILLRQLESGLSKPKHLRCEKRCSPLEPKWKVVKSKVATKKWLWW